MSLHVPLPLVALENATLMQEGATFGPFSLSLSTAESLAIMGPSGAGKSTLLQLLSGAKPPQRGWIRFAGRPLAQWPIGELSQRRALLAQSAPIAFGLSADTVVALGRSARDPDPDQADIVRRALLLAHASHLTGRRIDRLSVGELARIHLARVFAQLWDSEQGLLLADEPFAALDPGLQLSLLERLVTFTRQRGHALVAVLHDINQALKAFDRLLLIKNRKQHASLTADEHALPWLESLFDVRLTMTGTGHVSLHTVKP
jgi:iron complex transport system ATP-binding protein